MNAPLRQTRLSLRSFSRRTRQVAPPREAIDPALHPDRPCVFEVDSRGYRFVGGLVMLVGFVMVASPASSLTPILGGVTLQCATLIMLVRDSITLDSSARRVVFRSGLPAFSFWRTRSYNHVECVRLEQETVVLGNKAMRRSVVKLYWMNPKTPPLRLAWGSPDEMAALARKVHEQGGLRVEILPVP
jgi:hypothetical protein